MQNIVIRTKKDENDFRDLAFKPDDANTIYAGSKNIVRSKDGDTRWLPITGAEFDLDLDSVPVNFNIKRINLAVSPAAPGRHYTNILGT